MRHDVASWWITGLVSDATEPLVMEVVVQQMEVMEVHLGHHQYLQEFLMILA